MIVIFFCLIIDENESLVGWLVFYGNVQEVHAVPDKIKFEMVNKIENNKIWMVLPFHIQGKIIKRQVKTLRVNEKQ